MYSRKLTPICRGGRDSRMLELWQTWFNYEKNTFGCHPLYIGEGGTHLYTTPYHQTKCYLVQWQKTFKCPCRHTLSNYKVIGSSAKQILLSTPVITPSRSPLSICICYNGFRTNYMILFLFKWYIFFQQLLFTYGRCSTTFISISNLLTYSD